jgi:acetolactate synthase-1/2/3 large subunit
MKGAELFVKCLEAEGVKHVFGIPGTHVLAVYDELHKTGIKSIQVTHEQGAGFAADVYARTTKKPSVVLVTSGPGALNTVNSVAQAFVESAPLIIFATNVNKHLWGKGCYHELEHPDSQLKIFKEITKYTVRVNSANEIPKIVSDAFKKAVEGRPRPVFVEIPENVFEEETTEKAIVQVSISTPTIENEKIENFFNILEKSKNPLIIAGGGIIISSAEEELKEFSEALNIPVSTTIMGRSAIPTNHKLCVGYCGPAVALMSTIKLVMEADTIIAIGTRFDELATGFFSLKLNGKLIHIDIDETEFGKNYPCEMKIKGDAKDFLKKAIAQIKAGKFQKKFSYTPTPIQPQKSTIDEIGLVNPENLIEEIINQLADKKTILVGDAGNSSPWLLGCKSLENHRIITPSGYNSMGFSTPGALGAKLASPESEVIAISGDGSFLMTGMELLTAIKNKIDLTCVILHDGRYNILTLFQDIRFEGRYHDTLIKTFDFSEFGKIIGAETIKISSNSEIKKSVTKALSLKGVKIIEALVNPTIVPPLLSRLKQKKA